MALLISLLSSCKTTSQDYLYSEPEKSVIMQNLSNLNGSYYNYPLGININGDISDFDMSQNPSLNQLLLESPFGKNEWGFRPPYEGVIDISVLSDDKIKINYSKDGELLKSKILKGVFKDNYYSFNYIRKIMGFPLIFFSYKEQKVDLALLPNGDLKVYLSFHSFGGVFVLMGSGSDKYELTFKRMNE